jgi:hypothetical protein
MNACPADWLDAVDAKKIALQDCVTSEVRIVGMSRQSRFVKVRDVLAARGAVPTTIMRRENLWPVDHHLLRQHSAQ